MQGHHSVVLKLMQGHHYYYTVAQCSLGPVSRLHPWHFWWFSAAKRGSHAAIRVFGAPADPSICIWCSRHPLFGDAVFGAARQRVRIKAQRLGVGRGWELRALSQYEDSLPLPCHVVILCVRQHWQYLYMGLAYRPCIIYCRVNCPRLYANCTSTFESP